VVWLDLHEALAWVVTVANAVVGCWALAAHRAENLRNRALWWATGVAQAMIAVQIVLGVVAMGATGIRAGDLHMFYGFVMLATVGIVYSYRHQLEPHRYLLYGFGGLFLMGLGLRAIFLG
jgi:hypothetical protein